jgi:hypothetical protein
MSNADLRPMSLGEVLDKTFTLYRQHFFLFAGIAALPYLLILLFNFGTLLVSKGAIKTVAGSGLPTAGLVGGVFAGAFLGIVIFLLILGITHAATICAVSDLYLGNETTVRNSYLQAKGFVFTVIGVTILAGLATGVGAIFLFIPGIYLFCKLALSVPVAIVEKDSVVGSMERSMELTNGYFWQVFLLLLLVFVIQMVVGGLLQLPGTIFTVMAVMAKKEPTTMVLAYNYIAQFLSQVLVGPIGTISASLMYYNLRVRKEGFDIQHLMNSLNTSPRPLADLPGIQ